LFAKRTLEFAYSPSALWTSPGIKREVMTSFGLQSCIFRVWDSKHQERAVAWQRSYSKEAQYSCILQEGLFFKVHERPLL
jgi:hypothetical protein